jgi:hypothetical protein
MNRRSKVTLWGGTSGAVRGRDFILAPTSDRVPLTFQAAIYFKLNTDLLRPFHEQLGLQYRAYTAKGWNNLLQDTFRQQVENALQEQTGVTPFPRSTETAPTSSNCKTRYKPVWRSG